MNDFFRNLKINFEEFIEKLKYTDKKAITITISIVVGVILVITSIGLIANELKDTAYSAEKTVNAYIEEYKGFNYYEAYDYTILGKNGVDNYIEKLYLKDLKTGEVNSEEAIKAVNTLTAAYAGPLYNKASQEGFNNCDSLFSWYFDKSISSAQQTSLEDYATKKVLLDSFKQCVKAYKTITDEKLKDEYIGYDFKAERKDEVEFTKEEVKLYISAKSDKSKATFENAGIKVKKIKKVKKYNYEMVINSTEKRIMSVYLIKVGNKWYVDNTALI